MRSWTHAEEEALRALAHLGGPALAEAFDRSHQSIKHKAMRLGIRLERRSCGTKVEPSSPAILRKIRELSEASLCPACAKRPIGVKRTGLCGPCHLEALTRIHEQEIVRIDEQRRLWAARSKLARRRRSLEQEAL